MAEILVDSNILLDRIEELDAALPNEFSRREALPWEAAFLAGKCFVRCRQAGGGRLPPLRDFYIEAHTAVQGIPLLTRDVGRYRTYFPKLELVAP